MKNSILQILEKYKYQAFTAEDAADMIIKCKSECEIHATSLFETAYTFDDFWCDYDKKVGKDAAKRLWQKLSPKEKEEIKIHIPKYKAARPDKTSRRDPERYLSRKVYRDEIVTFNKKKENGIEFKRSDY